MSKAGNPKESSSHDEFEVLYRANLPMVYRFASSRLGATEGEDVTAEVFQAAAVAFTDGRDSIITPAWLMSVTRNKVIDRWRKASRRSAIALRYSPRREDLAVFPPDWAEDPRREDVFKALDSLTPSDRSTLVLHYLDGVPAPELAAMLDISVSAMESRLRRARRRFEARYKPEKKEGSS